MQLVKFDKVTGNVIDSVPWCLPYSLGLCSAGNHLWGLSSGANYGTKRIYEFDSMLVSINNIVPLKNNITVYPNPATDKVIVNSLKMISTIEIFNINGKKVFATNNLKQQIFSEIDLSNFQKGIYFIKIYDGENTYTKKIVLQ